MQKHLRDSNFVNDKLTIKLSHSTSFLEEFKRGQMSLRHMSSIPGPVIRSVTKASKLLGIFDNNYCPKLFRHFY